MSLKADGTTLAAASYDYDLLGRMTKATNPNGHATTYSYDKIGHLTKETDPLGNSFSYAYDENGDVKSRTDAMGRVTNYSYDPLDRLTTKSYPDGSQIKGTYDAVGNLLSATDETGTYSYSYDERNRLTKETFPGGQILQHGYDAASNRTSLTYPDGAKALYEYDAADRLTAVTDRAGAKSTYAYNSRNLPTKVSFPNGAGNAYTYDALGRVTQPTATGTNSTGGTTTLASLGYAYDKNSNPTSITDKDGKQSTFTYDARDRLTKEVHPDRTLSYAYDAAGNRKSLTRTTSSTSNGTTIWTTHLINYAYDAAERMMYAGSTTFAYDKNGNVTSTTAGTQTTGYSYDYEGALTKAGTKSYGRDPFERAVSSSVGKSTTNYLFDGPEAVQQKVGTATTYYTRGLGGQLINRRSGNTSPNYYHHDAIGSVVGLTDSTGALTDTYSYDAFGNVRTKTGTNTQPYQYLGNAWDTDSKLLDFHARAYDPNLGRFTSKDPISGLDTMPQTLNPYTYGWNNPFLYPDPSGLWGFGPVVSGSEGFTGSEGAMLGGEVSAGESLAFKDETNGFSWGEFYSAGAYGNGPHESGTSSYPDPYGGDKDNFIAGEYAGTGIGAFYTNADCVGEIAGEFDVANWNIGIPFVPGANFSLQKATSGDIVMWSLTGLGPGAGFSVSRYQTNTAVNDNLTSLPKYSAKPSGCSNEEPEVSFSNVAYHSGTYYINERANK